MNQIELHTAVDETLAKGVSSVELGDVSSLINTNEDARQYFFNKADERWLKWLWKYGFLEAIKEKTSDPNSYSYRIPELHYLVTMAEKKPNVVTSIMCSFGISTKNFNPEVIDQFTRISSKLPARCLKKIVVKIRDEGWVKLMGKYTQYGFEYAEMLKTLHEANDNESILVLAEVVLTTRNEKDLIEKKSKYGGDNIFYINDISETNVFHYLAEVPDKYQERVFSILIKVFAEVAKMESNYFLDDEDFFTLSLGEVTGDSYRDESKYLVATLIEITRKLFTNKKRDKKALYEKYFLKLPNNRTIRRLKLFVLSLDPQLFITELKTEYLRLFDEKKNMEILYGAEYERALKSGFFLLSNKEKRAYVNQVFDLFGKPVNDDEKRWKRHYASCILSTISENLIQEEIVLASDNGFKIDPKYQPEPSIGKVSSGTVVSKSPISADDLASLSIEAIVGKLKGELSPSELQKYKHDDFLNPRDAHGVAEQLKGDINKRVSEYLENVTLFFDRGKLVPHYTDACLRGIKDTLSEKRSELGTLDFNELFALLLRVKESGVKNSFSESNDDAEGRWLSDWKSVHSTIADLLAELIKQKDKNSLINFKEYRERLLATLDYLLSFEDPIPEDEKLKTSRLTVKDSNDAEYSISDPFTIAINSVRGRAFQALLHFVYQDSSTNEKKLADDVKDLYVRVLKKEKTRAMMFMFGHYLSTFYFRDTKWTRGIFSELFKSKNKDIYLQLAVWEGYLSNNLYNELFFEPYIQDLYSANIILSLSYPKQKFFKNPQESLAIHFALALVYFEEFGFDNELFNNFLSKASEKQLSEFINLIGNSVITGETHSVLKDEKCPWRITRVKSFWEFMLKNKDKSPSLKEFGAWIKANNKVFEVKWLAKMIVQTLDATGGELTWNYGLTKSIEQLATEAPRDTHAILEKHFQWVIESEKHYLPIREDKEWYGAFKILYESEDKTISDATYSLISTLIEKGGKQFWSLEEIVKDGK